MCGNSTQFHRLRAATAFLGIGVWLTIVSWVIGRKGDQVRADSGLGKGATFFFPSRVPLRRVRTKKVIVSILKEK